MPKTSVKLLVEELVSAGLLLSGDFARPDGNRQTYSLRLELLGSYPLLLTNLVETIAPTINGSFSRLLCMVEGLPLAIGLSLRTGIPLVYSKGTQDAPVFDLVGAYDIGHKALLVVNSIGDLAGAAALIRRVQSVGLDVTEIQAIVSESDTAAVEGIAIAALIGAVELAKVLHARPDDADIADGHRL